MKIAIIFASLFLLVYYDSLLLERRDREAYRKHFQFDKIFWAGLSTIFFVGVIPIYLVRRHRFQMSVNQADVASSQARDGSLALMSDALGVLVKWFFGIILFAFLLKMMLELFPQYKIDLGQMVLSAAFSLFLLIVLIYTETRRYSQDGFLRSVGLVKSSRPLFKVIAVSILVGAFFAYFSSNLIVTRSVQPSTPLSQAFESTPTTPVSIMLILGFIGLALLVAPLLEELIFRGYFFHVIKEYKNQTWAIYIISVVFALLHVGQYWGDWIAIGMVALLGFVLSLLRVWSGNTVSSITTHYVYNLGVTVLPIIIFSISHPAYTEYQMTYAKTSVEQKEELLLQSIEEKPEFADAYNDLAWLYAEEDKDLKEALKLVEIALSFDPQRDAFLDTKAEVLYKSGKLWEAIDIGESLVEKNPSNSYYSDQLKKFRDATVESNP